MALSRMLACWALVLLFADSGQSRGSGSPSSSRRSWMLLEGDPCTPVRVQGRRYDDGPGFLVPGVCRGPKIARLRGGKGSLHEDGGAGEAAENPGECEQNGVGSAEDAEARGPTQGPDVRELLLQAENGNSTAMFLLGGIFSEGLAGVSEDQEASFRCFLSAAQKGHVDACYSVGACYASGQGVPEDQAKATSWLSQAAKHGDVEAQYAMGLRASEGLGIARDEVAATEYFFQAAEQGHPGAQYNLGVRYATGEGMVVRSSAFVDGNDAPIEEGWGGGQGWNSSFGHKLERTSGEPRPNIAAELYKRAGDRGHVKAMYNLACQFSKGDGVPLLEDECVSLLTQAASNGYTRAQYALAVRLYREGGEEATALKWMQKAAYGGHAKAMYGMGLRYMDGRGGVRRSYRKAIRMFRGASLGGIERASELEMVCKGHLMWERDPEGMKARERRERREILDEALKVQQSRELEERIIFPGVSEQARARDVFSAAMEAVRQREERGVAGGDFMAFARKMNREEETPEERAARRKARREGFDMGDAEDGGGDYSDPVDALRRNLDSGGSSFVEENEFVVDVGVGGDIPEGDIDREIKAQIRKRMAITDPERKARRSRREQRRAERRAERRARRRKQERGGVVCGEGGGRHVGETGMSASVGTSDEGTVVLPSDGAEGGAGDIELGLSSSSLGVARDAGDAGARVDDGGADAELDVDELD